MAAGAPLVALGVGGMLEYLRDGENCAQMSHNKLRWFDGKNGLPSGSKDSGDWNDSKCANKRGWICEVCDPAWEQ